MDERGYRRPVVPDPTRHFVPVDTLTGHSMAQEAAGDHRARHVRLEVADLGVPVEVGTDLWSTGAVDSFGAYALGTPLAHARDVGEEVPHHLGRGIDVDRRGWGLRKARHTGNVAFRDTRSRSVFVAEELFDLAGEVFARR